MTTLTDKRILLTGGPSGIGQSAAVLAGICQEASYEEWNADWAD